MKMDKETLRATHRGVEKWAKIDEERETERQARIQADEERYAQYRENARIAKEEDRAADAAYWDKTHTHMAFPPYWFFSSADGRGSGIVS